MSPLCVETITVNSKAICLNHIPDHIHKGNNPTATIRPEGPIRVTVNGEKPTSWIKILFPFGVKKGILTNDPFTIYGVNAIGNLKMTKAQWRNVRVFVTYGNKASTS
tara:strand:+ start:76 stop:396 length:321 start_codon:yes stop_codon:yes gene_type:complete